MKVKINDYYPASSINTSTTTIQDIPQNESFEDVLLLNQTALKAMAIDAMVAESTTGSVDPDAVNAAAIMQFRNTLASHIVAPIPQEDASLSTSQQAASTAPDSTVPTSPTGSPETIPVPETSPVQNETPVTGTLENTNNNNSNTATGNLYNSGNLTCSDELNRYFAEASAQYGIDAKLLKSIAYCESNFNPNCTSHAGAMGIMQMMPATAAYQGVTDPYDARQSIFGGAKYLSSMLTRYNGDISLALAAYNAGPGNVDKYNGIPPFTETQNYVKKVLANYNS